MTFKASFVLPVSTGSYEDEARGAAILLIVVTFETAFVVRASSVATLKRMRHVARAIVVTVAFDASYVVRI